MQRVHLVVSGRVQGVFYRATCVREAERRGLAGWVRNLPDGRVEAAIEGPEAEVEAMVAWCRQGPPAARVDEMTVQDEPLAGGAGFVVRG